MSEEQLGFYLLLSAPSLALLYELLAWAFNGISGEVKWNFQNRSPSVLLRVAIVVAAVSIGLNIRDVVKSIAFLPLSIFFFHVSVNCMYKTRKAVVGEVPTFKSGCMKDKVVIVTGANSGIGKETARQLFDLGATVIMACRSEDKAMKAIEDIIEKSSQSTTKATIATTTTTTKSTALLGEKEKERLRFLPLDLSDFKSVREAAKKFKDLNLPLHVLINNAGVMGNGKRTTKDGLELCMQANHLGHFLFTLMVLPKLLDSKGRIINLSSLTYKLAKNGFDFNDPYCEHDREYTMFSQYGMSKLCNILFTKELVRRYPSIISYAVHPGLVRTEVTKNMIFILRKGNEVFGFIMKFLQKTSEEGAYTSVLAAAASSDVLFEPNGSYLAHCEVEETNENANNMEEAKKLWEWSEKQVGWE